MNVGDDPCLGKGYTRGDLNGEKLNNSASRSARRWGGVEGSEDEGGYSGVEGLSKASSTSEYADETIVATSTSDSGDEERVEQPDAACCSIASMISSTLAVMGGGVMGRATTGTLGGTTLAGLRFAGLVLPDFFLGVRYPYRAVEAVRLSGVGDGGGGSAGNA